MVFSFRSMCQSLKLGLSVSFLGFVYGNPGCSQSHKTFHLGSSLAKGFDF